MNFLKDVFIFTLHTGVLPAYVSMHHIYAWYSEARRKYRNLRAAMWMLGRAASELLMAESSLQSASPAPLSPRWPQRQS